MADNQQSGSPRPQGGQSSGSQQGGSGPKTQLSWGQPSSSNTARPATSASVPPQDGTTSSRLIGTFVAGLIIGLLIAWAWFDLRGPNAGTMSATSTSTDEFTITQTSGSAAGSGATSSGKTAATQGSNSETSEYTQGGAQGATVAGASISVPASQPAGGTVTISNVGFDQPVWAVVYSNPDRSGQVMGAARFAARHSGTIELVHMTQAGHTYYVGLVADTASQTYTPRVNTPILGSDGKQVMTQFTAK